jgi:hypothetical protein
MMKLIVMDDISDLELDVRFDDVIYSIKKIRDIIRKR